MQADQDRAQLQGLNRLLSKQLDEAAAAARAAAAAPAAAVEREPAGPEVRPPPSAPRCGAIHLCWHLHLPGMTEALARFGPSLNHVSGPRQQGQRLNGPNH